MQMWDAEAITVAFVDVSSNLEVKVGSCCKECENIFIRRTSRALHKVKVMMGTQNNAFGSLSG